MFGPLADLHRHLDGSLRPATVQELAKELQIPVPSPLCFESGMGLAAALERFGFTVSLLQQPEAIARVASEICEDASSEGVTTLELRFAPQLHGEMGMERAVDAALEGLAGRAGLILCGLYGESPELLQALAELALRKSGVVALDLAGGPAPGARFGMRDYAEAFAIARRGNKGRTVHAGEGRPAGEIVDAIELLAADRIGHGTTLLEDPRAVELLCSRGVTVEACITSNVHTSAISEAEEHPLARWLDAGVQVCINTDNTLLSDTTAPKEHELALSLPGMDRERLQRAIDFGHAAAFAR
jgi:adenosine deaminase